MPPRLVFGTGVVGMDGMQFQTSESVKKLLQTLQALGINYLDTAARYPPFNPGKSEQLLGEALDQNAEAFVIDTKVYTELGDGSGDLTRTNIQKSVVGSLERLKRSQGVNVLLAHRPDPATPLEEQIQGLVGEITKGRAKAWGVANHPPETLEKMIDLCEQNGWEKPAWYQCARVAKKGLQGTYNVLTRGLETRVLPILRAHNMSYLASHTLASGFLTGEHIDAQGNPTGRFASSSYANSPEVASAMKAFVTGCRAQDLLPVEVASRWLAHHSPLNDNDSIVLGASKLEQVGDTVANIRKGPLPAHTVKLVDELWESVKPVRGLIV